MTTLTVFLVAFFAGLGAPVQSCDGAILWGANVSCDSHRAAPPPPPPQGPVLMERKSDPRMISNGI